MSDNRIDGYYCGSFRSGPSNVEYGRFIIFSLAPSALRALRSLKKYNKCLSPPRTLTTSSSNCLVRHR
ncbi:Uncharacterized protein HZ326_30714 [Fusarium oxysporum f. sp. albedinis]|nr:Uncharacterized protein HZ326_30714 [Fusarium oxysporum f. sp. albedinis]